MLGLKECRKGCKLCSGESQFVVPLYCRYYDGKKWRKFQDEIIVTCPNARRSSRLMGGEG